MDAREKRIRQKLKDEYEHYAKKCLKIRTKQTVVLEDGTKTKIVPFSFNKAQQYIDKQLNEQLRTKGKIRAMILKGRQQGCSTYVGGRFYWKTTHRKGFKTFILTHRDDATDNLFKMTKRYHDHVPDLVKPSTGYSNRKELVFDGLDSAYGLGTAGGGDVGRSDTIDLFHGSEVAFWKNTDDIKTGVMQAAEAAEEIILESTANGYDPMFHPMWQAAEAGLSDYQAIFVPWFWQDEYRTSVEGFEPDPDEMAIYLQYQKEGMTLENLAWRRKKLVGDFSGDDVLFKQEYPCCAAEAFQVTGVDSFIKPEHVIKCRKAGSIPQNGAHIVGLDPARGGDRTAIIHRQGRVAWGIESWSTPDTTTIKGRVRELFRDEGVEWLFIDVGGLGAPIYDDLKNMEFGDYVIPVNFGSRDVYKKERYYNKRVEMWGELRDWLMDVTLPASVPDSDELQADLCAPSYGYDNEQRYKLERKEDMKKRGVRSPDIADALALTFASPVAPRDYDDDYELYDNTPAMV